MALSAEDTAAAAATEIQSGDSDDVRSQNGETDQQAEVASGSVLAGSLAEVMLLLTRLIQTMLANIAAAVKVDKTSHFDNAKLDVRNFVRIKTFTNKHSEFREWKNQFVYAVAECDSVIGSTPLRPGESREAYRSKG